MHYDYLALTLGPLAFATSLIDGYKSAETLLMRSDSMQEIERLQAKDTTSR